MSESIYSPVAFRRQAHELVDILADYLENVQTDVISTTIPWAEPADNLAYWQADFVEPTTEDPGQLFREIIARSIHLHHPRYMGHQVSAVAPLAALTGLLTGFLNNGMAVYEMGLASNPHERIVTDWLAAKLGFTTQGGGFLTSGGTLANLTALLAARAVIATNDIWSEGATGKLALMVSEEAHYCVDRAARIMGWGEAGIIKVPTNDQFQMRTDLLQAYFDKAQMEGIQVIAVVGSACSTSTGSYDNLSAIADFCAQHQLWFHVDGAHGGAVAVSARHKHLLDGIERADSVIVDFHKMMLVPALATAVIFKNPDQGYQTFQQKAQYLWQNQGSKDWFNSGKRTFECTKLMMATKMYVMLRVHGERAFEAFIDDAHALATLFAEMLVAHPAFELALLPQSNIVCFRYAPSGQTGDWDKINAQIRKELVEDGAFYIVQTTLRGQLFLRVTLMNPLTKQAHLEHLLAKILQIVHSTNG